MNSLTIGKVARERSQTILAPPVAENGVTPEKPKKKLLWDLSCRGGIDS